MLFRIIQYIGLTLIVTFCAFSIFLSISARDFNHFTNQSLLYNYASFIEDRFFDIRMRYTISKEDKENRLVLAAIDDKSLAKYGRWPWSRQIMTELVNKLNVYGAKVIAFDVFFSEPEVSPTTPGPDDLFANAIVNFQAKENHRVILPYSVSKKDSLIDNQDAFFPEIPEYLYNFVIDTKQAENSDLSSYVVEKKVYPIETLLQSDVGLGHIEASADADGVFRHYAVLSNIDGIYVPSFSMLAYEYFSGKKPTLNIASAENAYVLVENKKLHLNFQGESKVRWLGGLDHFPTLSIQDILSAKDEDKFMKSVLEGKLVYIGSTAFAANDLRNTPVDPILPGVVFHMNMTHMLLDGKFFASEFESAKISWILLACACALLIFIMIFNLPLLDLVTVVVLVSALLYIDITYLMPDGYNTRLFFCLFAIVACYSWSTFLHFYESNKEKKKIKGTFSRYLAPSIVNDLLKNPHKLKLGGERKNITVFFSDVRDFTSISEKLTPEELTHCLNIYMTMMTDTLFENKGTLDKYIGDAMVAYWGAPVELENHAYWAVKASLSMIEKLPEINQEFKKLGFPQFKHGIGLNTGDCSVGNMGSNQIFSYTALGDNMNLGARLESLCKFYGVQLNISEFTKNAIPKEMQQEFVFRVLDKVKVKGKERPVTIYEVLHPSHPLYHQKETLHQHEVAFRLYQESKFLEAKNIYEELLASHPNDPTFLRMADVLNDFLDVPPPPQWDGSYTHKSK